MRGRRPSVGSPWCTLCIFVPPLHTPSPKSGLPEGPLLLPLLCGHSRHMLLDARLGRAGSHCCSSWGLMLPFVDRRMKSRERMSGIFALQWTVWMCSPAQDTKEFAQSQRCWGYLTPENSSLHKVIPEQSSDREVILPWDSLPWNIPVVNFFQS
jgi:hypothetical protein